MGSLTNTYENAILDAIAGDGRAAAFPATYHVALFLADPTDAGILTSEVVGGTYGRVAVPNTTAKWPNAVGSAKSNADSILFPNATANWGLVTHVALMTAATGGAAVAVASVPPTQINTGESAVFAAGALVFVAVD